jgi:hypothetical protein
MLSLGIDDGKDIPVRLFIDGARVGEQKAERLPGNRWAAPRFYHTFAAAGWHSGHVEIDDPVLAADNKRYFAVEVPASTTTVPILAVNGAPSAAAAESELFFLKFALTAAPEGQTPPFSITEVTPGTLPPSKPKEKKEPGDALALSEYPLVILANVEKLSEDEVDRLERYADEGGNVLVFLGDRIDPAFYNETLAGPGRRNGGLLPARIKGGNVRKPVGFIAAMDYEHRALAAFQEPRLGTLLGPALKFDALPLDAPENAVLMKSSAGSPLLCEKHFGKGRVLLFASTCSRAWTDFPIRPGFLVWTRFLADYLTQAPLSLQSGHLTGETVRIPPPPGEKGALHVLRPDGKIEPATLSRDGSGAYEYNGATEPGVYAVLKSDLETKVGLFAVNLDPYESDLTYLDDPEDGEAAAAVKARVESQLKRRLGKPPLLRYVSGTEDLASTLGGSAGTWRLWNVFLVIVLLVGLFEPWLANQISGRMYGKPSHAPVIAAPGEGVRA